MFFDSTRMKSPLAIFVVASCFITVAFCDVKNVMQNSELLKQKIESRWNQRKRSHQSGTDEIMSRIMNKINSLDEGSELRNRIQAAYNNLENFATAHPDQFEKSAQEFLNTNSEQSFGTDNHQSIVEKMLEPDMIDRVRQKAVEIVMNR